MSVLLPNMPFECSSAHQCRTCMASMLSMNTSKRKSIRTVLGLVQLFGHSKAVV